MSRLFAGIDSGSWTTKAVLIDEAGVRRGAAVVRTGANLVGAAFEALVRATDDAQADQSAITAVWSTGFGRHRIAKEISAISGSRTELDCHARGAHHYVQNEAFTVVDIGGQDAKIIYVDERGVRTGHKMNRKCAAGTGSFLDEMAMRLNVAIEDLPVLATRWQEEVSLGSFCTVFSATELLGLIREGKAPHDLARAAYKSVIKRVLEMAEVSGRVVGTGGVLAHHPMAVELLSVALNHEVTVPPLAQQIGALGAALAAREAATAAQAGGGVA